MASRKTGKNQGKQEMEQLPKIVQRRLQRTAKAGVHPDPDLLTAFAEKALPERERTQLLQHLAECADCRDVISLAVPQEEPAASGSPARQAWMTWPVLRWGALAACVVVVGAAVTLHYDRQTELAPHLAQKPVSAPSVTSLTVQSETSNQPNQKLAAKIAAPSPFESDRDFRSAGKLAKQNWNREEGSSAIASTMSGASTSQPEQNHVALGDTTAVSRDKNSAPLRELAAAAPAAPPAAKAASAEPQAKERTDNFDYAARAGNEIATVETESAAVAQSAPEEAKDEARTSMSRKKAQNGRAGMLGGLALGDRKTDAMSAGAAGAGSGATDQLTRAGNKAAPRWTISADGAVQRSFDSGQSWQTIPVAGNVVFRALSANGSDVWAGGTAGALYHSSDAGLHWTQVKPSADGKVLAADIITVEFTDARHGKLTTADHETWTTSDAGETWHNH